MCVVGLGNVPGGVVTDVAQGELVQPDGVCMFVAHESSHTNKDANRSSTEG